jgi:galactokinase
MSAADRSAAARRAFTDRFGTAPMAVCDSPGRVNLIGEHIDYAGGCVLPFAIPPGISVAAGTAGRRASPASAVWLDLHSAPTSPVQPEASEVAQAGKLAQAVIQAVSALGRRRWPDPVHGPVWQLGIWSDLPLGSGLSSSAAFTVAVAGAVMAVLDIRGVDPRTVCRLCRDAEESATGVQCGLMDQYAVMFGCPDCAALFDPSTLSVEQLPLMLPDTVLAVIDSGQPRRLAASSYNQRRAELAAGHAGRVRHVATEKQRVVEACSALRSRDPAHLGALLCASHASLRDDYAVSTPQLDLLCDLLTMAGAAYGARLTGAGFGGNVLALLRPAALEPAASHSRLIDEVLEHYVVQTGLRPTLRLVEACAGAQLATAGFASSPVRLAAWTDAGQGGAQ